MLLESLAEEAEIAYVPGAIVGTGKTVDQVPVPLEVVVATVVVLNVTVIARLLPNPDPEIDMLVPIGPLDDEVYCIAPTAANTGTKENSDIINSKTRIIAAYLSILDILCVLPLIIP